MNGFSLKPQLIIAEILPGFAMLAVLGEAYLYGQQKSFHEQLGLLIRSGTGAAAVAGAFGLLASWVVGSVLDTIGNVFEEVLDCWSEVNWRYLADGDAERIDRINQWFFAYYLLDRNYLFGTVLVCLAGVAGWISLPAQLWIVLGVAIPVLGVDGWSLRRELKHLLAK
jgi:hypothetical protein